MTILLFAIAAVLILVIGLYLSFTPDHEPRHCPSCGTPTRFQGPFLMCDACEMMVGVSIEAIYRDVRKQKENNRKNTKSMTKGFRSRSKRAGEYATMIINESTTTGEVRHYIMRCYDFGVEPDRDIELAVVLGEFLETSDEAPFLMELFAAFVENKGGLR